MKLETIVVGAFGVNCYVVWQPPGRAALVVDPGADPDRIEETLRSQGLEVAAYLVTHGHVDHVSALAALCQARPAPVEMHPADAAWAFGPDNQVPPFYPPPRSPGPIAWPAEEGMEYGPADLRHRVLATPGHSVGSVCFFLEAHGLLFTGDTLFEGTVGRTDLPGGDEAILRRSLVRLAALPAATRVFPGHGEATTLARERAHNPFLAG
jgi:glyoxylase-like metal-dependent hydrolase (beta-lactamase superfamily II)